MPDDLGPILSAVTAYGDQRATAQHADDEAACQARVAAVQADLDALQAEYTAAQTATPPVPLSWGINIKPPRVGTPYADTEAVFCAVLASGATWVRDNMALTEPAWTAQRALWQRLASVGVGVHAVAGTPETGPAARAQIAAQLHDAADWLTRVEGWNEPTTTEYAAAADHQRWLWSSTRDMDVDVVAPALLIGPSVTDSAAADMLRAAYSPMTGAYDFANLHVYPGGKHLSADYFLDRRTKAMRAAGVTAPILVTEGGYVTAPWKSATVSTEANQGKWLADYVQQVAARPDLAGFAAYELLDNVGSFGIFDATRRPKLAVDALASLAHQH